MMSEKIGRPTKMTEECVQKLEHAFSLGCTDVEACMYADISQRTLYNYQEDCDGFLQRKEVLKSNPFMKAREVLYNALVVDADVMVANKMIDRKEGSKVALTGAEGGPMITKTVIELVNPNS